MEQGPGSPESASNLPKVGRMNQDSIENLTERLRSNPAVREEAIERLRSNPRAFAEEVFDLTRAEENGLRAPASEERANLVAQVYILALNNPGIRFAFSRIEGDPEIQLELALRTTAPSVEEQPTLDGDITMRWFCR
jgi:hypothetical protein